MWYHHHATITARVQIIDGANHARSRNTRLDTLTGRVRVGLDPHA
jgi:hypothetical protein